MHVGVLCHGDMVLWCYGAMVLWHGDVHTSNNNPPHPCCFHSPRLLLLLLLLLPRKRRQTCSPFSVRRQSFRIVCCGGLHLSAARRLRSTSDIDDSCTSFFVNSRSLTGCIRMGPDAPHQFPLGVGIKLPLHFMLTCGFTFR